MTSKGAPTMKRRLFSILLALCMTLAMLPAAAFAKSVSFNGEIIIENNRWEFADDETVCYYIPGKNGKFSVNQPNSDSYLKVTKTGENEITITVHGNVNISVNKRDTIKSIKNLIITGATGKDTLSLSTTKDGTAISVLGDLTVTGITLTATAGNGHALRANNITVSDATLDATNNSADSATIQATQGDGPLGNLTVSGTSAITVTNNNATGHAIHATIINGNETPGQTDASQVTISSPAPHSHICSDGWTSDATGHWHRCADANCTEKLNFAAHIGGTATCTRAKKCEVCGQSYGELDPSNHTALSDWASNETHHWKVCADCNATGIDNAAHTYGDWIIDKAPTATEAGLKHRTCSVCSYKETATIPATGPCTHEGTLKYTDNRDWSTHKVECTACGQVINAKEAHAIHGYRINDVAGTHQEFCNKCSYNGPVLHHSNFIYVADGDSHYKKCGICGVRTGMKEAHIFENGSCTACGAADPSYVPPTDPAPVEPTPGGSGIIITSEAADLAFLSGANQAVAVGGSAVFRIDYNYAAFRSVAVDGVTLTPADYTTWTGSTWVKLTAACTKSLTPGTHTLSVYFDGATAATTFTVGGQPNPATGARDAVGITAAAAAIALLGSAALLRKK